MKLHDLRPADGSRKERTRVGRGIAAGKGKTAGPGTKGQKARSGGSIPPWFEGGQTPLHVRIPKLRGFKNRFKLQYEVVNVEFAASRVMLKPASQGTGVIAGGSVRAVLEAAGVRDILSKIYGSTNPVNVTRATLEALRGLHSAEELSARRGVKLTSRISGQPAPTSEATNGR